jgi:hypothetical protein
MKSEDRLKQLCDVMDRLGFQREPEESPEASTPRQVHALGYTDRQGNRVQVRFSLQVGPGLSGLVIEASFNDEKPRIWDSLDAAIDGIPGAVKEWLQPASPASETGASSAVRFKTRRSRSGPDTAVVLDDIRAGLDDQDLMEKHGLSHRRLLSLMSKLVWEGLLTQEELARRKSMARTVMMPVYQCRLCQEMRFEKTGECPRCGGPMVIVNKRQPGTSR